MTRQCGGCTLCCKLVPVAELGKPAGVRCRHQITGKGCRIYGRPAMPGSCRAWSCQWLIGEGADTADLRRPDRMHYVIDMMPDYVTVRPNDGGKPTTIPVLQIWVDPDYPDAHHDPALRAFLARRGEQGLAALLRFDSTHAITLFPPAMCEDGQWHEEQSNHPPEGAHRVEEVAAALARAGVGIRYEVEHDAG